MKEQDYIDVHDLSNLRSSYNLLSSICISNQSIVNKKDYATACKIIYKWITALESKIGDLEIDEKDIIK